MIALFFLNNPTNFTTKNCFFVFLLYHTSIFLSIILCFLLIFTFYEYYFMYTEDTYHAYNGKKDIRPVAAQYPLENCKHSLSCAQLSGQIYKFLNLCHSQLFQLFYRMVPILFCIIPWNMRHLHSYPFWSHRIQKKFQIFAHKNFVSFHVLYLSPFYVQSSCFNILHFSFPIIAFCLRFFSVLHCSFNAATSSI